MDPLFIILCFAIAMALLFDLINGMHDAANSIATVVSTRVLSPRVAVWWAAGFNFLAMFTFPPTVANTISKLVSIRPQEHAFVYVVLAGLLGAIAWNLLTWWWGLPTSSSHALVGGLAGAGLAFGGWEVLHLQKILSVVLFIPLAPILGGILGFLLTLAITWQLRRWRPRSVDQLFRRLQLLSAAAYSVGHGGNDAQKTMGILVALLVAGGRLDPITVQGKLPLWIVLSCNLAMALGTALGGWRIVKTMGMKLTKLSPMGGFCAELSGASTLFVSTLTGVPVSTTHTITGAIIGVGATKGMSTVRWSVASRIVWAWLITIPAAATMAILWWWLFCLIRPLWESSLP